MQSRSSCYSMTSRRPSFTFVSLLLFFLLLGTNYCSWDVVEGWSFTHFRRNIRLQNAKQSFPLFMAPRKKNENVSGKSSQISPDLMDFFSKKETSNQSEETPAKVIQAVETVADMTPSFESFEDAAQITDIDSMSLSEDVATLIAQLEGIVSAAGPSLMTDIVPCIQQFSLLQQSSFRSDNPRGGGKPGLGKGANNLSSLSYQRMQQAPRSDEFHYRLLWVGSDDAMSTLGTGLHKVPLARLQEVFLSLSVAPAKKNKPVSKFRITGTEVIRILGPFPNVKNTLQGICSIEATTTGSQYREQWNIVWESMIDGTGKELINTTSNQRVVPLSIVYGDAKVFIAATAPEMGAESLFVFLRDEGMEEKLAALRVL